MSAFFISSPRPAVWGGITGKLSDQTDLQAALDGKGSGIPSGSVNAYAGASPPDGWLWCDGSEVSRTAYAALFAIIGEVYGAGNASTTFNLPDLRGRVAAGKDDMGGVAANRISDFGAILGGAGGNEVPQSVASHTHILPEVDGMSANPVAAGGDLSPLFTVAYGGLNTTETGDASDAGGQSLSPTLILNQIIKT